MGKIIVMQRPKKRVSRQEIIQYIVATMLAAMIIWVGFNNHYQKNSAQSKSPAAAITPAE